MGAMAPAAPAAPFLRLLGRHGFAQTCALARGPPSNMRESKGGEGGGAGCVRVRVLQPVGCLAGQDAEVPSRVLY